MMASGAAECHRTALLAGRIVHGGLREFLGSQVGARGRGCVPALNSALDALACRVVLFRLGSVVFVTFGLFAALGAFFSLLGASAVLAGQGVSSDDLVSLALGGSAAVVGGSWLVGQLLDYRWLFRDFRSAIRRPIFVSWGGLVGMLLALAVFAQRSEIGLLLLLDALARSAPLGHALGRLGCLSYGCCFGRPTGGPIGVTYRHPAAKAVRVGGLRGVRLHPAALYEAVLDIGILLTVNLAAVLCAPLGVPAAMTLLLYGTGRFGIEFLRNNDGRLSVGRLSLNHVASMGLAIGGAVMLVALLAAAWPSPSISWPAAVALAPRLLAAATASAIVIFIGFAVHWRRVGAW